MDLHLFSHIISQRGVISSIFDKMRGLFNLTETDTSTQKWGVSMQSVTQLMLMHHKHSEQTHIDHMRLSCSTLSFMAGTSIQKLQAQLAPAQSSHSDQASCYNRRCDAEKSSSWTNRTSTHTHTHTPGLKGENLCFTPPHTLCHTKHSDR